MPKLDGVYLSAVDTDSSPRVTVHVKTKNTGEEFSMESLRDTGTTQSIIDVEVIDVKDRNEVIDSNRTRRIYAAYKSKILCLGTVDMQFEYYGKRTLASVLVAVGLHEKLLISTNDQIKMGILHSGFPKPHWAVSADVANVADSGVEEGVPVGVQAKLNKQASSVTTLVS